MFVVVYLGVYTTTYLNWVLRRVVDALELFREFYRSLGTPLSAVIEFKLRRRGVAPAEVLDKPWLLTFYIAQEMGHHNVELFISMFVEYARRRGVDSSLASEALRSMKGWRRFV
ncbi:MAG: hypothetical protein ABWK05_00880, partial [Pyrobaculum sp.]